VHSWGKVKGEKQNSGVRSQNPEGEREKKIQNSGARSQNPEGEREKKIQNSGGRRQWAIVGGRIQKSGVRMQTTDFRP
jgi:hypothetical protein